LAEIAGRLAERRAELAKARMAIEPEFRNLAKVRVAGPDLARIPFQKPRSSGGQPRRD